MIGGTFYYSKSQMLFTSNVKNNSAHPSLCIDLRSLIDRMNKHWIKSTQTSSVSVQIFQVINYVTRILFENRSGGP